MKTGQRYFTVRHRFRSASFVPEDVQVLENYVFVASAQTSLEVRHTVLDSILVNFQKACVWGRDIE